VSIRRSLSVPPRTSQRLYDWLHGSPTGLLALALAIGAGAGAGAVLFRYLILWFTLLFTGHQDGSTMDHGINPLVPFLGAWVLLLVPVVGGLIYGPLVDWFAREARGHGVPEVMLAVAQHGGRIRPQVAIVKSLASALCIGSGGSVGREGPIVQIGSALGSSLGQLLRVPESRLRLLVACGAAAGISATFNAPIAGVVFALELILRDFEAESFGVVVPASVVADVIGRAAFGSRAFLELPPFQVGSLAEYGLYAGLGILAAVAGVAFIRVLYGLEDVADRVWRGPEWLRPAAGGVVLGLLLFALPQMYGVGYPVLENAIRGQYAVGFLFVLFIAKILATSLTIAIGGSGGVFAPSLVHGRHARNRVRGCRADDRFGRWRSGGWIWSRGNGRSVCGGITRADDGRHHHLRAHRRLSDHLALDVRRGPRDCGQQPTQRRHDLYAQAAAARH
jgi:CIC family chloride channel protein